MHVGDFEINISRRYTIVAYCSNKVVLFISL